MVKNDASETDAAARVSLAATVMKYDAGLPVVVAVITGKITVASVPFGATPPTQLLPTVQSLDVPGVPFQLKIGISLIPSVAPEGRTA